MDEFIYIKKNELKKIENMIDVIENSFDIFKMNIARLKYEISENTDTLIDEFIKKYNLKISKIQIYILVYRCRSQKDNEEVKYLIKNFLYSYYFDKLNPLEEGLQCLINLI